MSMIGRIAMAVFALGAFAALSPAPAYAACSDADRCTEQECNTRQSRVHPTCDQPRSCNGITDQAELQRRLAVNQACLAARQNVQACFSAPDSGHNEAITGVQNAIDNCQAALGG
ncbi:hypothetical protein [Thalassospira australica]|uniref:hypothetical protein n=1 Tax=Thalassospira australica TaxID=1528106 RepID=UPI00384BF19A